MMSPRPARPHTLSDAIGASIVRWDSSTAARSAMMKNRRQALRRWIVGAVDSEAAVVGFPATSRPLQAA
jgi:hypothetical protein